MESIFCKKMPRILTHSFALRNTLVKQFELLVVSHTGVVFAAIASVETVVNVVGSVAGNEIYSATLDYYRGFVFFVLRTAMSFALY